MVKNLLFVMVVIFVLSSQSYAGFGDLINKAQKAVENKTERAVSNIGKDDPIKILSDAGFSNYQELKTLTQDIPVDRPDADLSRFEDEDLFQKINQTSEALKQLESDKLIQDTSDQKLAVSSIESFNTAAIQYLHDRDRVIEKYYVQLEEKKRQEEEKERQEKESKRLAAEREKERLKKEAALEKERQEQMALLEKEGQAKELTLEAEQPKQVTNEDVSRDNPPSINLSECEQIKNFPLHSIGYTTDAKELNSIMSQYFGKPLSDWIEDDFDKYKRTMISCRKNNFFRNYGEEDFPDTINESIEKLKKEQKEIFFRDQATQQWNALRKESEQLIEKIKDFTISDAELDRLREIENDISEVQYECNRGRDYYNVASNIQDHIRDYNYTLEEKARQEKMDKERASQENKNRQRLEAETKEAQELVKKYGKIGPPSDFLMARLHTYVGGELSDMCTVIKFYDALSGKKKWDKKSDLWVLTQNFKDDLTGEKHEFLYAFEDYRVEHSFVLLSRAVMDDEEVPTSQLYRFIIPMLGD